MVKNVKDILQIYIEQNYNTDPKLVAGVISFVFDEYDMYEERKYVLSEIFDWIGMEKKEIEKILLEGEY